MIQEIKFDIYKPINLNELFDIPEDKSIWREDPRYIINKSKNHVPNRDIFLSRSELLVPKNKIIEDFFDRKSSSNYGIYILIFNDFKKFYVGIAARYSFLTKSGVLREIMTPEGFFTRLGKHRAKCTGTSAVGVNHTNANPYGWRDFALEREKFYTQKKQTNSMDDCQLSLVVFNAHEEYTYNDKGILERLENHVSKNGISNYFGEKYNDYKSFAHTRSLELNFMPVINNKQFLFRP